VHYLLLLVLIPTSSYRNEVSNRTTENFTSIRQVIENFDGGSIELLSYPEQDSEPDAWALDSIITYNNSAYALKLFGNTWKLENISPITIDTGDVWQIAAYVEDLAEIHGFGLVDSAHTLFYSFAGTEQLDIDEWVTVYQGAFPLYTWHTYKLPVADDWLASFDYLPIITSIVFINDRDIAPRGAVYFDEIIDITGDLPIAPEVDITYSVAKTSQNPNGERSVDVQFHSDVYDPDSPHHLYYWYFGDDSTSRQPNPLHTYLINDDHEYTVMLEVVDRTGMWGRAICQVTVDSGITTFPIRMNFTGDIMLARRYEQPGGVIDTLGVEAIFDPTLPYLGNAADITVANLECPLTSTGTPHPTKPIIFRGSPENVAGLVHAGIDVVSLANNHIIDYGLAGMRETQSVLRTNDILYSGAGANSYDAYLPLFYNKSGVNIAFLASSNRTGQYDNYQPYLNAGFNKPGFANLTAFDLARQISEVENTGDLVVVEMHAGIEYDLVPSDKLFSEFPEDEFYSPFYLVPSRQEIELRHQAVDQGADLVICHHPHVLQGFEVYDGKLIAHSLGNFAFDQTYTETFPSAILNAKINETGFYEYSVTPVYIDDYIPRRAKGELGLHILDYLSRRSQELGTYLIVNRDSIAADIVLDTAELVRVKRLSNEELELFEEDASWISAPVLIKDKGSISSIISITPTGNWQYRLGREVIWFGNFEDEGSTLWLLDEPGEFYDTTSFQGHRSLCQVCQTASPSISTNFKGRITCYSDSTYYTVYGFIKTENANNVDLITRFYRYRTYPYLLGACSLSTKVNGTTGWTFYYEEFFPANNTRYFDIWLKSTAPQTGSEAYTWFDNVGIIEWETWQPFTGEIDIPTPNDFYWLQIRTETEQNSASLAYRSMHYYQTTTNDQNPDPEFPVHHLRTFPNPSNSLFTIEYNLRQTMDVELVIYNVLGQEIRTLVKEVQIPGNKAVIWDGKDNRALNVSSGLYFCELKAGASTQSQKIILVK
jgi:poly-gamma-glutamate capsule biosynthesis protein CapA/YwtB (metallophosphatase superfamily)